MKNNDVNFWDQTPNLAGEFNPVPKPEKKAKALKKRVQAGVRTLMWKSAHPVLDAIFLEHGVIGCEIQLEMCIGDEQGYAHVVQRVHYTPEELINPKYVVKSCNPCHTFVDQELPKPEAEKLLSGIVKKRGW